MPTQNKDSYLLPLITKPEDSKVAISSLVRPISPRRGILLPSLTYWAIASPSPGNSAPPKLITKEQVTCKQKAKQQCQLIL